MLGFFPIPYPDETLYSVICRFNSIMALPITSLNENLFGNTRVGADPVLPRNLDHLTRQLPPKYPFSEEQIIQQHTLYNLAAIYLSGQDRNILLASIKKSERAHILASHRYILAPKSLRLCPACKTEEISKQGEAYWHRTHQFKGVTVCPIHRTNLAETDVPSLSLTTHGSRRSRYVTASSVSIPQNIPETPDPRSLRYAELVEKILSTQILPSQGAVQRAILNGLLHHGLATKRGKRWQMDFEKIYHILRDHGCPIAFQATLQKIKNRKILLGRLIHLGKLNPVGVTLLAAALSIGITNAKEPTSAKRAGEPRKNRFLQNKSGTPGAGRRWARKVDYQPFDIVCAEQIPVAKKQIVADDPLTRITKTTLIRALTQTTKLPFVHCQKLPLTTKALSEAIDTHEQFALRAISIGKKQLEEKGRPLTPYYLAAACRLLYPYKKYPVVRKLIMDACAKTYQV